MKNHYLFKIIVNITVLILFTQFSYGQESNATEEEQAIYLQNLGNQKSSSPRKPLSLQRSTSLSSATAIGSNSVFNYTGGFQEFTVPTGVTSIRIESYGAQGASGQPGRVGGRGAKMSGDFSVTPGDVLILAVGGMGQGQSSYSNGGGGGGTFVVHQKVSGQYSFTGGPYAGTSFDPIIIAGGGGGTRTSVYANGNPGVTSQRGTTGSCSGTVGGGSPNSSSPGYGGKMLCGSWGSAGGGLLGNGQSDSWYGEGGNSFISGAFGGNSTSYNCGNPAFGGFGGGGQGRGCYGGGGGGGYTGGDGGRVAGGGGSFNIGLNQINTSGHNEGNGYVRIEFLDTCEEPVASCKNISIQLDSSGNADITTANINNGSTANCGLQSMTLSQYDFTCNDIGVNQVTLTVTDVNGTTSTCTANVDVQDNVNPVALAKDITVQLDAIGTASITASDIDNGSNDACGILSLEADNSFDCSHVGANTITLTVTDNNNNVSTTTAVVTVEDNVNPVALAKDITVQLDAIGTTSITASDIDNGSNDACGILSLEADNSFDCSHVGANTVTLTVTDNNNNVSTTTAVVTVEDNVNPVALAKDITVQLDAIGTASITASDIDNGSNDACGILSLEADNSFDCSHVGTNTVTLTVTDNNNNVSTTTAVVTVEDNVNPVALAKDITVQLDAIGTASITASDIDNGSNDACGILSLEADNSFDCSHVGANTVTLTVTDNNNNVSTTTAVVTVEDNVNPVALAKDITVQLDAIGTASITASDIDNGSNDACGILSLEADNSFDCSHVGANTVTLTVTDNNNNVSTTTAVVTVEDNVNPVALAKDITVQLDAIGTASITASDIDNGSNDACGILSLEADNSFDCSHVGANTITLTVTDNNNNVSTTTAVVTVEDNVNPVALAKDITVQLDAIGTASITASDIDNGSNDACGILSLEADNSFDCSHVGANTVTLTVTDNNNNVSTTTAVVTVEDNVNPVALAKDITVQLDAIGTASITASDIDNGSNDACGILSLEADNSFDCSHVGANTVTLTVTDNNNNVSTTTAVVTVEDNVNPVALAKDITVQLDAIGTASITASDIDNGSNDACGILSLEADNSFDCSHVGANTVTLTVTDNNNNVSTTTAVVTVEDNVNPVALAKDITVQLDAIGTTSITASDIDNGSNDACGILSLEADNSFDCSHVGANTVTLTVTDNNNNVSTTTAVVTVEDNVNPVALAKDITVQLDAIGTASITASDIDNGSNDACGILSLEADNSFDCSHVGANTVTLTVTDNNNNVSTTTAVVTVEDNVNPVALAKDITVQLDAIGTASITASDIDNGSNDACGIASLVLSQTDFDCSHVGDNEVTLTVTDTNDNVSTITANVDVQDNVNPVIVCVSDQERYIDPYQTYYTVLGNEFDATATDACGIASLTYTGGIPNTTGSAMGSVQLSLGVNTMNWTTTDNNDNESDCSTAITVVKRPTTLTYNGDVDEQYSDSVNLSATLIDDVSGNGVVGKTVKFTIGTQTTTAVTDGSGVATTTLILTQDPAGIYTVKSKFSEDASYLSDNDEDSFDIAQEDAGITFTGSYLVSTGGSQSSSASVLLSATIQDISAVIGDPSYDSFEGEISNATVQFINGDDNSPISPELSVIPISATDNLTGTVNYSWNVDIGNLDSEDFNVRIVVKNYYTRDDATDNVVITVSKELNNFVTGGGYIILENSIGTFASDAGTKCNFGFNIKPNKSGKKLQGRIRVLVRRTESDGILHTYQIKGNRMESLAVDDATQYAVFYGKANVQDVTDPLNPITAAGNGTFKVEMTDNGEPGEEDLIAFTLWDNNGGLRFSSNWAGVNTQQQLLDGGNLMVHGNNGPNKSRSSNQEESDVQSSELLNLEIKSWPNPSDMYFNLKVTSLNSTNIVNIFVFDVNNRLVHNDRFNPQDEYHFGKSLQSGTYLVKITQADKVQYVRLVKY